jgi:hypothetical protein
VKRAVDPPDQLLDVASQLTVLADLAAARHGDLHERDTSAQIRAPLEQELDRTQALDDPLRVVEPVDTEEDAAAAELGAQAAQGALGRSRAGALRKVAGVDRDRVRRRQHPTPGQGDRPPLDADVLAQARARAQEVVAVRLGVEGDDIGTKQPVQHLLAPRQPAEDLRRRERHVQEEPDRAGARTPEQTRHEHQVVVVHPAEAASTHPDRGETLVHVPVGPPPAPLEDGLLDQPVQQRPKRPVRKAVVVVLDLAPA